MDMGHNTSPNQYLLQRYTFFYIGLFVLIIDVRASFFTRESESADVLQDERYQRGKAHYEAIQAESKMPKYSKCWTQALELLTLGCKRLDDDTQHRLAFAFTNCFLAKTGKGSYICSKGAEIADCVHPMTPEAYNTYTEFFTNTQNICFFLQAQVWQAETMKTVSQLTENSALVAKQIEDSGHLQNELLKRQNDSLVNQDILLLRGNELKESAIDVQQMMKDFQAATAEQRDNILDVFDRIQSLQSLVMGEFTGFYSMVFYTTSLIVSYLLTSTPRTNGARFWLFFLMTLNVVMERLIVSFGADDYEASDGQSIIGSELVYKRLSLCRKMSSLMGMVILFVKSMLYRDLNVINHELLQTITEQNQQIKHLLQSNSVNPPADTGCIIKQQKDHERIHYDVPSQQSDSALGYESDLELSNDSILVADEYKDDGKRSDTEADRLQTSGVEFKNKTGAAHLFEELQEFSYETPVKHKTSDYMTHIFDPSLIGSGDARTSTPQIKRGRPRGRRIPLDISEVPSPPRRYNLRSRSGTPRESVGNNVLEPDFDEVVQHLAKVSRRNTQKTKYTLERRLNKH